MRMLVLRRTILFLEYTQLLQECHLSEVIVTGLWESHLNLTQSRWNSTFSSSRTRTLQESQIDPLLTDFVSTWHTHSLNISFIYWQKKYFPCLRQKHPPSTRSWEIKQKVKYLETIRVGWGWEGWNGSGIDTKQPKFLLPGGWQAERRWLWRIGKMPKASSFESTPCCPAPGDWQRASLVTRCSRVGP